MTKTQTATQSVIKDEKFAPTQDLRTGVNESLVIAAAKKYGLNTENVFKKIERHLIGKMGGFARAKMYDAPTRSRWAKMGGAPPGIQADVMNNLQTGPKTTTALTELTKWPAPRIRWTLWRLKRFCRVKKLKNQEWALTAEGNKFLQRSIKKAA